MNTAVVMFSMVIMSCSAQRSPYAGRGPIGYPAVTPPTTTTTTTTVSSLADRFGEDTPVSTSTTSTTTIRLPIEALGDADLYNRLLKLPADQQPFWLINWRALEANRNNPQTFSQKSNTFIDNNAFNFRG